MRTRLQLSICFAVLCLPTFGFVVPPDHARHPQSSSSSLTQRFVYRNSYRRDDGVDKDINNIFEQNRIWVDHVKSQDPNFFEKLGSGHNPKYLWIGCADARVPANEIMGEDPGSVFVIRNVANLVVGTDFNLMSALQYAVAVLKVDHIILCGHYECGGIRASLETKDHVPPLENWLRNIRDVYRLHRDELDSIQDPEYRHRRLVELNVVEQCINLFKTGVVQRRRVETFKEGRPYTVPRIHACVFDPKTGDLNRLEVNFREYIQELHEIYDLYSLDDEDVVRSTPHAPSDIDASSYNSPASNQPRMSLPPWDHDSTARRTQRGGESHGHFDRPQTDRDSSWSRQEWVSQDATSNQEQWGQNRPGREWEIRDSAGSADSSRWQQRGESPQRGSNGPYREGDRYLSQSDRLDRDTPRSTTWNSQRYVWDIDTSRSQNPAERQDRRPRDDRMYPPQQSGSVERRGDEANRRDSYSQDGNFRADTGRSGFDWHGR